MFCDDETEDPPYTLRKMIVTARHGVWHSLYCLVTHDGERLNGRPVALDPETTDVLASHAIDLTCYDTGPWWWRDMTWWTFDRLEAAKAGQFEPVAPEPHADPLDIDHTLFGKAAIDRRILDLLGANPDDPALEPTEDRAKAILANGLDALRETFAPLAYDAVRDEASVVIAEYLQRKADGMDDRTALGVG